MQTMLPGLALGKTTMDVQAFQAFYQENLGPIYRYVYHQVSNREEAEDLTSEIFLKEVRSSVRERGLQSMQFGCISLRVQRSPTTGGSIIVDQPGHSMHC